MKTRSFNPVEMLHSDEEVSQWLSEAYDDEDSAILVAVIGNLAKYEKLSEEKQVEKVEVVKD